DTRKWDGHVVRPGTNDDAIRSRFGAEGGVGFQIALHVIVVPAAEGEHGNVNLPDLLAHADGLPERIVGRVVERLLPHWQGLSGGGVIGTPKGKVEYKAIEFRRLVAGSAQILAQPQ